MGAEMSNLSDCDDTMVLKAALESDGTTFDIGLSGTAMRFLAAFLAQKPGVWTLTGNERMKNRPIGALVDALNSLGANIEYVEHPGFPPLHISGRKLSGGMATLTGSISSQFVSALMMIAPAMEKGLILNLEGDITSKPYINLTMEMMRQFNANVEWEGERRIRIMPVKYAPTPITVEADWSAASYWYSAVSLTINRKLELTGLSANSFQGDSIVAKMYERLGVQTTFTPSGAIIKQEGRPCERMEYDFADTPDLAQTLAVGCCLLDVPFKFTGLRTLRIKETDRIAALIAELAKLGYILKASDDETLVWNGARCPADANPIIQTYDDHRMAMAFTPAALKRGTIEIAYPLVVSKSYPSFWQDIVKAGGNII
jgi:3-phosphoshikimate 1-carboxyvinyltransferase